jgi:hypothetical protein
MNREPAGPAVDGGVDPTASAAPVPNERGGT